MKNWILQHKLYLLGAAIGAVAGYLYWQQIGCATGTCAITSKPINSTVYFAVMGSLFLGMFAKNKPKADIDSTPSRKPNGN